LRILCICLVALGAIIMLYSIVKFYRALALMRWQMNEQKLFGDKIYLACFVMMLFFLVGYVVFAVSLTGGEVEASSLLIALIFFFGAIFVYAMVTMMARMFTSITDRERLRREIEVAENGSRMKGEFLSRMSHEMRTPMNAIIGMTVIGKNADDMARKDYCFAAVEDASRHLLGVINDVLDMSKIESSKMELTFDTFHLRHMLDTVVNLVSPQVGAKHQTLTVTVGDSVPAMARSDEQRLRQVVLNLLSNAVKFTPDSGTITLRVRVLAHEPGRARLQFEVQDTGIGMTQEQQTRLFTPFEQADSSISRKFGGTGLGLAISKQIIDMLGGAFTVRSEPGHGSSFSFDIWVECPQAGDPAAIEVPEAGEARDYSGRRALIAEDIEINREILSVFLEPSGLEMAFAENGRIACEMFAEAPGRYDIIFMDVHMPEVSGIEAAETIRQMDDPHARAVPIVAMTADVLPEDIDKCLAAGMSGHVGKPIDLKDVLAVMAKHLPE